MTDNGRVAVVTGGSRGAGRGIAIALGCHGYTVYVTGRTQKAGDSDFRGTIHETAESVTAAGGRGIAVAVDHHEDDDVKGLFERVSDESGRLDILVNNAAMVPDELQQQLPFWEKPLWASTELIDVGLRSSLVTSYYAAPLLIESGPALVTFTSAPGAVHYQFGPAYGAHKASLDKFAADMAVDFRPYGVTAVSIWMGAVLTERLQNIIARDNLPHIEAISETPEFTGHVIAALYDDPNLLAQSGRTLIGAEVARQYGVTDAGGKQPPSFRDLMGVEPVQYRGRLSDDPSPAQEV